MIEFKVGDKVVNKWRLEYENVQVYTVIEVDLSKVNWPVKIVDSDNAEVFTPYIDLVKAEG